MSVQRKHNRNNFQPVGRWIRPDKRLAIYLRDKFTCQYCECDLHNADVQSITLDHVKAKSRGGSNEADNLITSCRTCNCSRQDKTIKQFADKKTCQRIRRNTKRNLKPLRKLAKAILAGEIEYDRDLID